MKSLLAPLTLGLISLLLVWSIAGWFMAKTSKQRFDLALDIIANGPAKDFFELEVLGYQKGFYGTSAELKILPTSDYIDESVENWTFFLQQINGPIFINRDGIQFGFARWQLSAKEIALGVNDEPLPQLRRSVSNIPFFSSISLDFFGNTHFRFESPVQSLGNWFFDSLVIKGDVTNAQHQMLVEASGLKYRNRQLAIDLSDVSLTSNRQEKNLATDSMAKKLTKLTLNVNKGQLFFPASPKKILFNLQSHSSIWIDNGTLSSDLQVNAASSDKVNVTGTDVVGKTDVYKVDADLQLRDFLLGGLWQYLHNQAQIFSLLQQAEWAVEEVETPEQQDYLRSLFLDAGRIKKSQRDNSLKPLLIAGRSQLAMNIRLSEGSEVVVSQLSLGGNTISSANEPELTLRGEARIRREMLNKRWLTLLEKWNNRQWFRRYETEFESDITVRNGRLLLNDLIMPVDRVSAELSRALTDQ